MTRGQVRVLDSSRRLLAVLDNATDVSVTAKLNELSVGSFALPVADPKNAYCAPLNFIGITRGARDMGLYRIVGSEEAVTDDYGALVRYSVEHVMATLLDDAVFGYYQIGGTGVTTRQVLTWLLNRQGVKRWQLGDCDFNYQFEYKFENVDILKAILSVSNVFAAEYTWDFDTTTTPWTVHLRRASTQAACGIHYRRNLRQIAKTVDAKTLITRLYCLGYGEGNNQLTIKSVNGGVPYIDADTAGTYGIHAGIYADTTIDDPATLFARGRRMLEEIKIPYTTYSASALDLSVLTGEDWDTFLPGKIVRVMDDEHDVHLQARITEITYGDLFGDPGNVQITISNTPRDMTDVINALADRQSITDLCSQGATTVDTITFADNAQPGKPIRIRVRVSNRVVRVNEMMLVFETAPYRAYSVGAAAGGGKVTTTKSAGGGTTTSAAGGDVRVTTPVDVVSTNFLSYAASDGNGAYIYFTDDADGSGKHRHKYQHYHRGLVTFTIPEMPIQIPSHTHTSTTPGHQHSMDLEAHTHDTVYGIYEGPSARSVTVRVDGNLVPPEAIHGGEVDIAPYLATDDAGRVRRGTWHEVTIDPDTQTRIEGSIFTQQFIQSVGGTGDY